MTRLSWLRGDAQREQKNSRARSRNNTMDIRRSEKLCFYSNLEEVLNQLNYASRVEKRSCEKSYKVMGFLFDQGQKGKKGKSFN